VLFNVTGGEDLGILEVNEAADIVARAVDPEAQIIWGAVFDPNMPPGTVKVTLIATGFDNNKTQQQQRQRIFQSAVAPQQVPQTQQQPIRPAPQAQAQPVRPAPQTPPQPQQRPAPSFSNTDDLDIPPFLRNRRK